MITPLGFEGGIIQANTNDETVGLGQCVVFRE
jgi:hypothetical protein